MFKNILKHIDLIENNRDLLLDMWMNYEIVQAKLIDNTMDVTFFRDKFATKVFDFAISVVKGENKKGDCPVIGVMLMLFKKKNIPLSDVYMICVHLKNALLHFAYRNSILDDDAIKELSILMDYNFEGVINEYVLLYYKDSCIKKVFVPEVCPIKEEDYKKELLITQKTQIDSRVTSAEIYLQEVNVDLDLVSELYELESETLDAIDAQEIIEQNALNESSNLFKQYAKVLNTLYEFEELAYTLTLLSDVLLDVDYNSMTDETKFMVDIYLKAIISDLQSWRMSIFITKQAENIHYLDKTLLSSIAQIQIALMPQVEREEEEIEFF